MWFYLRVIKNNWQKVNLVLHTRQTKRYWKKTKTKNRWAAQNPWRQSGEIAHCELKFQTVIMIISGRMIDLLKQYRDKVWQNVRMCKTSKKCLISTTDCRLLANLNMWVAMAHRQMIDIRAEMMSVQFPTAISRRMLYNGADWCLGRCDHGGWSSVALLTRNWSRLTDWKAVVQNQKRRDCDHYS